MMSAFVDNSRVLGAARTSCRAFGDVRKISGSPLGFFASSFPEGVYSGVPTAWFSVMLAGSVTGVEGYPTTM